jgi:hypothetical protein
MTTFDPFSANSPQWTLLGFRDGSRCVVLGSQQLSMVELRHEWNLFEEEFGPWGRRTPDITLNLVLRGFSLAYGATYQEALAKLFGTWDPDRPASPPRVALPPPRDEISPPG